MRLAEPETLATDQVVTLSQAIRREVASMGDGIERALARASELETLVRSEVSTMERSYSDNERRIRSLIAEMADQREAIVANGGRVRAAIAGAHQGVAADLDAISDRLNERLANAGRKVVSSLSSTSEDIATTLDRAGAETVGRIAEQGAQMREALDALGADVTQRLAETSNESANALLDRIAQIDERLKISGEAFAADFGARGEDLVNRIDQTGARASEAILAHGDGDCRATDAGERRGGERVWSAQRRTRRSVGFQQRARFLRDPRSWRGNHRAARAGRRGGGERVRIA